MDKKIEHTFQGKIQRIKTTEIIEKLFILIFKEDLTRKELFEKMGLEIKDFKHKKRKV